MQGINVVWRLRHLVGGFECLIQLGSRGGSGIRLKLISANYLHIISYEILSMQNCG